MTRIGSLVAALALAPAVIAAAPAPQSTPAQGAPATSTPPQGSKPTPATPPAASSQSLPPVARDLARALTPAEAWKGIMEGYASSLSGQISAALASSGKEAPANLESEIRKELDAAVRYEQAIDMQARALAGRFSADELRALESFYRSGPGKKLLEELPEIARQVNDELRTRLSAAVPQIVQKYAPSIAGGPGAESGAAKPSPGAEGEGTKPAPKVQGRTPPAAPKKPPSPSDQR